MTEESDKLIILACKLQFEAEYIESMEKVGIDELDDTEMRQTLIKVLENAIREIEPIRTKRTEHISRRCYQLRMSDPKNKTADRLKVWFNGLVPPTNLWERVIRIFHKQDRLAQRMQDIWAGRIQ